MRTPNQHLIATYRPGLLDDFQSVDDMSRAPVWRTEPEQRRGHPTTMPQERDRQVPFLRQTINNPRELSLPGPSVTLESQLTTPNVLSSGESDESSDEFEHISAVTPGGPENDQGDNDSSDSSSESYCPTTSDSETLSDMSYQSSSEEDACLRYLSHNGTLRGMVDGVLCEFTPQHSPLNLHDDWYPYARYPFNFQWSCCGARCSEPHCLRTPSPASDFILPDPFLH